MPCCDLRYEPSFVRSEAHKEYRHNSPVAELLCEAMQLLTKMQADKYSPALTQWWAEHQERDQKGKP